MLKVEVYIKTTNQYVASVYVAQSFFTRFKGLMLKKNIAKNEGLLITSTKQIHTFWMRFAIDIIYLKQHNLYEYEVIGIKEAMQSWRMGRYYKQATDVLELKQGMIKKHEIKVGEKIWIDIKI